MSEEEKEIIEKLKHTYFNYETYYLVETAINCIEKLQKENEKNIRIFNEIEKIMNKQERTIDKLRKENRELKRKVEFYRDSFNNAYKEFEELRSENEILERKLKL